VDSKPDSTQLALDRTWLAHERTLMAWVRTATSMISFGFTIYKFFDFESGQNVHFHKGLLTPRDFALMIVSIGMVSLWIATFQHHKEVKFIKEHSEMEHRSLAVIVAGLVSVFGVLVLLAAIFRN
jgi:putative membrane protein